VVEEAVPVALVQAVQLLAHRGEAPLGSETKCGTRTVWSSTSLEAHSAEEVRDEAPIRVPAQPPLKGGEVEASLDRQREVERHRAWRTLKGEVPHDASCPRVERALADCHRVGAE